MLRGGNIFITAPIIGLTPGHGDVGNTITITGNPSISGTAEVGQTLTGSDGTATGTGTTSVTARQWYRDGVAISGATGSTYDVADPDDGADITFGVTWTDDNGTKGATSAAVSITYAAPTSTGSLANQTFNVNEGNKTYDAAVGFTGDDLTYSITASPDATNITINPSTGVITFDTDALIDSDDGTVTVQVSNSGGTASDSFTLTMNSPDTTAPGVTNYAFASDTISADVDEPCNLYWSITTTEETTNSNIKDGTGAIDNGGPIAIESGSNSDPITYSGTDGSTTYWLNLLWEDASGNQTRLSNQYVLADTTAPSVSSATDTQTGATTADWGCTSDEASGTIYAAVRLSASSTLTKSEIENGTGNAVATDTDASPTADANNGGSFTGLTASTAYTVDLFQRDAAGNESAVVSGDGFTTASGGDVTAPTLSSPVDAADGANDATGSVDTDEGNGTLYWVCTTSSTAPSAAQVKAGNDHTGSAAADSGSQSVSGTGTQTLSPDPTGLTASTAYYIHFMHEDAASNQSSVASGDGFTTASGAGTTPVQITLDGANDYLERGSDFTSDADSNKFTLYMKIGASASASQVLHNGLGFFDVEVGANNINIIGKDSGGTEILDFLTKFNDPDPDDGTSREWMISYDGSVPSITLYVDGVVKTGVESTLSGGTIDFTRGNWALGAQVNAADKFTGTITRIALFRDVALDLSVSGNRDSLADPDDTASVGGTLMFDCYTTTDITAFDNQAGTGTFDDPGGRNGAF